MLKNDYVKTNFPNSNMSDAINHFAGKKFTKVDCSQAYHCVQMADDILVQLLSFNFASRTYAYKCLAQGLNRSVTGFSSFITWTHALPQEIVPSLWMILEMQ